VAIYLESLGVPESDLHAISYGKDRPLCLGHEESCWQQNRRVTLRPGNLSASTPRTVQ
jgi:outer membrane protein OmpA-like peptidoglycan-associated protein